jgi:hypothetical protein
MRPGGKGLLDFCKAEGETTVVLICRVRKKVFHIDEIT